MQRTASSTTVAATVQATSQSSTSNGVAEIVTLRLTPRRKKKAVKWSEDVVDNEFLNKKSSKKCCIFHKQRPFGEWSDDEDGGPCRDSK
ncbi:probable type 1 phosphatases regulator YPI1 [Coccomyxa sp. Obi]|nr:probable type 1 phosphatases regulator YPI1 [Coccomyxa sp. Obi]